MKKMQILAIAALAAAVTFQTAAKAEDPVSPVPGAVCNLYLMNWDGVDECQKIAASLASQPAVATFVDSAISFSAFHKKDDYKSNFGMWTGWIKQEKAATYTFVCKQDVCAAWRMYWIWINGKKCVHGAIGQTSFNVDMSAGFNSVIIIDSAFYEESPLIITYKKAGSLKEPEPFGPGDMFHDAEED